MTTTLDGPRLSVSAVAAPVDSDDRRPSSGEVLGAVRHCLGGVVVLGKGQDGLAVLFRQFARDSVVVLRLVRTAAHRAPVGVLQKLLGLDLKNGALVHVGLALPFAL